MKTSKWTLVFFVLAALWQFASIACFFLGQGSAGRESLALGLLFVLVARSYSKVEPMIAITQGNK